MKRLTFTTLLSSLFILSSIMIASCSSDPAQPENEIDNKHHEDPFSSVFTLIEGKLKEGKSFSANLLPEDVILTNNTQVIYYTVDNNHDKKSQGFHIDTSKGSDKFVVKNNTKDSRTVYMLKIDYYNKDHQLMNDQFFENDQDKIHQHFFQLFKTDKNNISIRENDKSKLPFDYVYADDYKGKFIGKENPMGFKGFVIFKEAGRKFDLKISLMHSGNMSKFDKNHKASDFYIPSNGQITNALWDFQAILPIEIK